MLEMAKKTPLHSNVPRLAEPRSGALSVRLPHPQIVTFKPLRFGRLFPSLGDYSIAHGFLQMKQKLGLAQLVRELKL